ncbi:MAG: transposase family protein [Chloroflexi bacterium]|nr:transposase family protein [Chloroflexota bacterium]
MMGVQFGISRSKACESVHKLMPILHKTLVR